MTRAAIVDQDSALLFDRLAARLVDLARAPRPEGRKFAIALSGGSTPEGLFQILATKYAGRFPWSETEFFWADERAVPPSHPESNYGMAARTLFAPSLVPSANIHRMMGELTPTEAAATEYAETLESKFGAVTGTGLTFDVALLGIGPDGHTASLFPNRPSLNVTNRWTVVENEPGQPPPVARITLTLPALNRSERVFVLATGSGKRPILEQVWRDPESPRSPLPVSRLTGRTEVVLYLDSAAAPRALYADPRGPPEAA